MQTVKKSMLIGFLTALSLSSCFEEPDCLLTATNSMKIVFKTDSGMDQVSFVGVTAAGIDTVFYAGKLLSTITLPLDPATDITRITFVHELGTDSIRVSYRRQAELVNPDCGAQVFYKGLSVEMATFSKVNVLDTNLQIADVNTRDVVTNLEIFR